MRSYVFHTTLLSSLKMVMHMLTSKVLKQVESGRNVINLCFYRLGNSIYFADLWTIAFVFDLCFFSCYSFHGFSAVFFFGHKLYSLCIFFCYQYALLFFYKLLSRVGSSFICL